MGIRVATAAAAALLVLASGPVPAAPAKKAAAGLQITLTNNRQSAVTAIGFLEPGTETGGKNLLKTPLAAGQSRQLQVPAKKGQCLFDVLGSYEDEVEISGSSLNLCKDRKLVLVD